MTSLRVMLARLGVLAVLMAGVGEAPAQQFMMGQGSSSCGSWTEARKTKDLHQDAQQQWVFGFCPARTWGSWTQQPKPSRRMPLTS